MATYYFNIGRHVAGGAGTGTITDPWDDSNFVLAIGGDGYNAGDVFRHTGLYTGTIDAEIGSTGALTFDGWNGANPWEPECWKVTDVVNYNAGTNGGHTTRRGAFSNITFQMNTTPYTEFVWDTCYFYHNTVIQAHSGTADVTWRYKGCTFKTPLYQHVYMGGPRSSFHFEGCVFDNTVFDTNSFLASFYFINCYFVGKTKAQVQAGILDTGATAVFTNCVFEYTLNAELPSDITTISESNLRYAMYFGEVISDSYGTYPEGFKGGSRQGPGAFYFGSLAAEASASKSSGKAPFTTEFSGNSDTSTVDTEWDFGDGETSNEQNPEHTYSEPGEYEASYTITDSLGNTSTATLTIYVYNYDYSLGYVVSKTDFCVRWALPQEPAQGQGWAFYDGVDWPQAIGMVGTCEGMNSSDERVPLVMDGSTYEIHELGRRDQWTDGQNEYRGSEIESDILFPEVSPPVGAAAKLKHNQSHLNLKPWFKEYRGATGYTADGFKESFESDVYWRVDSEPTDRSVSQKTPLKGQIVADRHFESEFIQMGTRLRVAPWRLSSAELWVTQIDTSAAPAQKLMTEMSWALEFTEPLLWVSRSQLNPIRNRAVAENLSGSYAGLVKGPDGYSWSAVSMAAGNALSSTAGLGIDTGNYSVVVWLKQLVSPYCVYKDREVEIEIREDDEGYVLKYEDEKSDLTIPLDADYAEWTQIAVVRNGGNVVVYENGRLTNTAGLTEVGLSYHGAWQMCAGTGRWFDMRIVPRAVSENALRYLYNDVIDNQGNATCPVF